MIFSVILRNIKTYSRLTYVPVSNGFNFTSFIGENGVGKSSVIEALDTFFNKSQLEWNLHHSTSKGINGTEPVICPIFLIPKKAIHTNSNIYKYLELLSDITWQIEFDDFNSSQHRISKDFCQHRDTFLKENINAEKKYFLFPLGLKLMSIRPKKVIEKSLSIFDSIDDYENRVQSELSTDYNEVLEKVLSHVNEYIRYIYIPSDVNIEEYTKIESQTTQSLMGTTVDDIIKDSIDKKIITSINTELDKYIERMSLSLEKYVYRKPGQKQTLFNISHLSSKIVETYFESKVLNLKTDNGTTPIYNLSSGERRMALIDLALAFLKTTASNPKEQIILAIDEPEISLHTSSCFEQFEKIKEISTLGVQTLLTTHWYGFMPIVSEGLGVYVANFEDTKTCSPIDLRCFRDEFKRLKKFTKGQLPKEIELKSTNDLVQSIVSSVTNQECNWIICEGSSDSIYLNHFISGRKKAYILPIGKSSNVKKLFSYLYLALGDERDSIKGRVFLLLDTDRKYEPHSPEFNVSQIRIRRLLNCIKDKKTKLKLTSDNDYYPPTEIEDSLSGEVFFECLSYFASNGYSNILTPLLSEIKVKYKDSSSGMALDLTDSQKITLTEFFDLEGVKIHFALKYKEIDRDIKTPDWVEEIIEFLI
ncbi:AAA family ATPase [Vibrio splendidus]|uniref:AAA family ATPase n=1 Tax=Vibrio splendidus TaxID=29497 RepID=UPI0022B263EE|nr:AAA family ATPase [Vibrio splendidus]MCC4791024.1 ATP-binding protein [Vibrio splendidus]